MSYEPIRTFCFLSLCLFLYGGARLQHLARPCRKVRTLRGRDVLSRLQRGLTPPSNVPLPRTLGQCDDTVDITRENQENGSRGRAEKVGAALNSPCGKQRRVCKPKSDAEPEQPIYRPMTVCKPQNRQRTFENFDEVEHDDPLGWGGGPRGQR